MVLGVRAVMKIGMAKDVVHFGRLMLIHASDDDEDETAELMRELEKIKKERAEQREREVGLQIQFRKGEVMADMLCYRSARRLLGKKSNESTTSPWAIHYSIQQKISTSDAGTVVGSVFSTIPADAHE